MNQVDEIIDHNGVIRKMGWVPPKEDGLLMRASRTSIRTLRTEAGLPPVIPRTEWKPKEYVSRMGSAKDFILDQYSSGGCSGWSGVSGLMRVRALRGRSYVRLSGACLYARVNGGKDNGSNIIDTMNALAANGVCSQIEMDFPNIHQIPSNVTTWYREDEYVTISGFDEWVTAVLMGMMPQGPIYAGRNLEKFVNGVAGYDRPPNGYGNHSVCAGGLVYQNGQWLLLTPNTWKYTWGPFVGIKPEWAGCMLLTEKHINDCSHLEDGYAHASDVPVNGEN